MSEVASPTRGSETVLLVEDDATVRELTCRMLRNAGYNVLSAAAPAEAIECAVRRRGAVQLLLTDVVMPGGNGRQLAETLASRYPGLAVLFMSGYTRDVVLRKGVVQESVAFLPKPFTEEELGRAVRQALHPAAGAASATALVAVEPPVPAPASSPAVLPAAPPPD